MNIANWENDLQEYTRNTKEIMDPKTKVSCLEDLCPIELQEHLSDLCDAKQIYSDNYAEYKQAISNYLHKKIRFAKHKTGQKLNSLGTNGSEDEDPEGADETGTDEPEWKGVEQLLAMVKGKFARKGKGKGNGGKNNDQGKTYSPMEVDKPVCHECGDENHFVRDCPVRIAKNLAKGKDGKGKNGKEGKGGGKGGGKNGKNGKNGYPNMTQWNSYYPGPSPATWKNWYPYGQNNGKVNLFEQPLQLSSLRPQADPQALLANLFSPGNFFKLNVKGPKAKAVKVHETDFTHVNKFAELATPHEDTKPTIDPSGSGGGGTSPLMRQPGRNPTMGNFGQNWPKKKLLKAAFEKQCGCSQGESRGSPEHACPRGLCSFESPSNSETMPGSSVPREGSSRPTFPGPSGASNSGTTRPKVTTQVNLTDAIKKPSLNVLRKERIKQEPSPAKLLEAMSEKVNPDFLSAINEAWTTGTSKLSAHALKLFRTTSVARSCARSKLPPVIRKSPRRTPGLGKSSVRSWTQAPLFQHYIQRPALATRSRSLMRHEQELSTTRPAVRLYRHWVARGWPSSPLRARSEATSPRSRMCRLRCSPCGHCSATSTACSSAWAPTGRSI